MRLGDVLAALSHDGAGRYASEPPASWRQGRTLYGGLTSALCVEAARRHVPALPPLRALQIAFVGPAAGPVTLRPELLRRGRSAAFVAVDAVGDDGVCARATLTCGVARDGRVAHDRVAAPSVPEADACPPASLASGPAFLAHFEVRFAGGGRPFRGGPPEFAMWVRHRDPGPLDPTLALVAVADVLPPAASPEFQELAPVSSMTWSLELARPAQANDWHLLRSASECAADGYSVQTMGCWDANGRCLALGRQVVAIF